MASVTKRKWVKPNGSIGETWMVRYVDDTGARRGKSFDLKKQAEAFRMKVERESEAGTHTADALAATVAAVFKHYAKWNGTRVKDGRLSVERLVTVETHARKYILPAIGAVRFRDITARQVTDLYATVVNSGCSPAYGKAVIQNLRTVEGFARRHGYLKTNPVADAMYELRGIKAAPVETLSTEQVGVLLKLVLERPKNVPARATAMLAIMVHLAACCGLRAGEIRALAWQNLDLDAGELHVRQSITASLRMKGPKTAAGVRTLPLPAHLVAMLTMWRDEHASVHPAGLIFTTRDKAMTHTNLHLGWRKLLDRAGYVGGIHFHALRHFAASWWIENGTPLPEVAHMLGHSKVDMTMAVYAHSLTRPAARRDAIERMAGQLTMIGHHERPAKAAREMLLAA